MCREKKRLSRGKETVYDNVKGYYDKERVIGYVIKKGIKVREGYEMK